ncbi:MAG: hypothetical protein Q4Q17_02740 [Tissierellia bacterium]|nr:hypothetical protein [Tissierellia bacterium]
MEYENRLMHLKKELDTAKEKKSLATGKLSELEKQKQAIVDAICKAGSTPETLEADIKNLEVEIEELFKKCEALLPKEV